MAARRQVIVVARTVAVPQHAVQDRGGEREGERERGSGREKGKEREGEREWEKERERERDTVNPGLHLERGALMTQTHAHTPHTQHKPHPLHLCPAHLAAPP